LERDRDREREFGKGEGDKAKTGIGKRTKLNNHPLNRRQNERTNNSGIRGDRSSRKRDPDLSRGSRLRY
jgi:hypothetical protein